MSDRPDLHVGDWGFPIVLQVKDKATSRAKDISNATTLTMLFQKPGTGGETFSKDAILSGSGDDGKMQYTLEQGIIDTAGEWSIQGLAEDDNGTFYTDIEIFTVGENIIIQGS